MSSREDQNLKGEIQLWSGNLQFQPDKEEAVFTV
jgi:hypothetical protein